jgi:hypothetical protein
MCKSDAIKSAHHKTHEQFVKDLSRVTDKIIIIGRYNGATTDTEFQCDKGHIWSAQPNNVLNGTECPYCTGKSVLIGYNDMWTTRPDVAKLLKNPEDGYQYSCSSGIRLEFVCPDCKTVVDRKPCTISYYGFSCQVCSDNISYPNKFGRAFLKQLPIKNHKCEYQPDWAKPYSYDNFFEYNGNQYILEMDGGLHYRSGEAFHKPLEERQRIDCLKTFLAIENGVNIIRINCLESNCEYIKDYILNSELKNIFDLSIIDWSLCDMLAQKNLVKEVCQLYQNGIQKLDKIAQELSIGLSTVSRYLKIGAKFGWCDYKSRRSKNTTK